MLKRCDAALVIGDAALFLDYERQGLEKVDLGDEWAALTSLPFVWATWVGRSAALTAEHVQALQSARTSGVQAIDKIVTDHCPDDEELRQLGLNYLRKNMSYTLDDQAKAGLEKFLKYAYDLRLIQTNPELRFY